MLTLKEWRRAKGITQQTMADALGVHVNTYAALEKEPERFKVGQAQILSDMLGVALSLIDFNTTKCCSE